MAEIQDYQALRDDIEKLKEQVKDLLGMKDQMAKILKHLDKKDADESAPTENTENHLTSVPHPHNSGTPNPARDNDQVDQWPRYGLPIGYTPRCQAHIINLGDPSHSHIPNANLAVVPKFPPYYSMSGFPHDYITEDPQSRDKLQMLEERLRVVEGSNARAKDAKELCLVPNVIIPPKFKMLDSDKYDGETNSIAGSRKTSYTPKKRPQALHFLTQTSQSHASPNYPERKLVQFDQIPMSYSNLFNHLTSHHLISPRPMKPIQPPFPRGYDQDATCEFHAGAVGLSVENCKALKHVIQDLIDSKWLNFNDGVPNQGTDPFPGARRVVR